MGLCGIQIPCALFLQIQNNAQANQAATRYMTPSMKISHADASMSLESFEFDTAWAKMPWLGAMQVPGNASSPRK